MLLKQFASISCKIGLASLSYAFASLMLPSDAFAQTKATDGPFGVSMGSQIESYKSCEASDATPGMYHCATLPKPHPEFASYVVQYHPNSGVCWVKGVGREFRVSVYGSELESRVDKIAKQVENTYGKLTINDFLSQDSIWDEPKDWLMGLRKGERYYAYNKSGGNLKNDLKSIYIGADGTSSETGRVIAEFAFKNEDTCENAIQDETGSAF